jgi:hypothetical protein
VKTIVNLEWLHDDQASFQAAVLPAFGRREIGYFRVRDWEPPVAIAPGLLDKHVARRQEPQRCDGGSLPGV